MKTILSFLTLVLVAHIAFSQKQDVEVFEKKEGDKVIVMARNTGKIEYKVGIDITSKGMDVKPAAKTETSVPAGFMKELANLTPRTGEAWEYSYNVTISSTTTAPSPKPVPPPTVAKETPPTNSTPTTTTANNTTPTIATAPADPQLSSASIILYSKPGCSRCAFVKKQLTSLNIPFEEYSTSTSSPEINNMWAGLRSSGFTGGSVTMPVVRADGKYYYNIQDLEGFVNKLKK